MAVITATRTLEFDAAHRVLHHEGKCRHLHGHRYTAEITVSQSMRDATPGLDDLGRVVDFSYVKRVAGKWIDDNWDHNALLNSSDPLLRAEVNLHDGSSVIDYWKFNGREPYLFLNSNPTAENIARELYGKCKEMFPADLVVLMVRIWETPNCYADYSEELSSR